MHASVTLSHIEKGSKGNHHGKWSEGEEEDDAYNKQGLNGMNLHLIEWFISDFFVHPLYVLHFSLYIICTQYMSLWSVCVYVHTP